MNPYTLSPPSEGFSSPSVSSEPGPSNASNMLLIKIMSPALGFPKDVAFRLPPDSTIKQVKEHITVSLDSRPPTDQQRLIYRGKMMQDENVLESVLGIAPRVAGTGPTEEAFTFHLMIRPSTNSSDPAPAIKSVAEPISPTNIVTPTTFSGMTTTARASTSISFSSNVPVSPPAHGVFGAPTIIGLEEMQQQLRRRNEYIAQRLAETQTGAGTGNNAGVSIPGTGNTGPAAGTEPIGEHPSESIQISSTTTPTPVTNDSGMASSSGVSSILPTTQRRHARIRQELENMRTGMPLGRQAIRNLYKYRCDQQEGFGQFHWPTDAPNELFRSGSVLGIPQQEAMPVFALPNGANVITGNNLIFLLQDTRGRSRALLVGPPGSVAAGDLVGGMEGIRREAGLLPFDPRGINMPDLRGLGLPPVPNAVAVGGNNTLPRLGDHFGGAPNDRHHNHHHRAGLHGAGNLERPRIQVRHINYGEIFRVIRARASHFWLAVRLAVFVFLFTGSGGWRRMLYLGSIALLIFVWQTGIFDPFFRPLAEAINRPRPHPAQPQQQDGPLRFPLHAGGNPIDPRQLAEVLYARRQQRFENVLRGIERVVMVFLTSLIPGLHERHVNAVEQRQLDEAQREQLRLQQHEAGGEQPPPAPQPEPQREDEVEPEPAVLL